MLKFILPVISLLLLPPLNPLKNFSWHITSLSLIIVSFSLIINLIPPTYAPLTTRPIFSIDLIRTALIILTLWISTLIFLTSYKILNQHNSIKLFISTVTILATILIISFSINNFLLFYIFFEASLIPTLFLILAWGYQPERLQAGIYLIIYTVTASLPLLTRVLLIYSSSNNLSLLLPIWPVPFSSSFLISLWWIISILAFLVKIPLYFFHLWLPKAHVEAPIAGSIILAAILLKLGSYGLLRLLTIIPHANSLTVPFLIAISIWGAIITSIICLRQPDLKALIAYSSVGHIGILTAGLISSFIWGWYGSLILILSHGLCSSAIFSLANIAYDQTNTRSIFLTKGLLTIFPSMTLWWLLFSIANIAAPPSMNLIGEIFLLTRILAKSLLSATIIASLSFLAAAYSLHLYTNSQHGPSPIFSNPILTYPSSTYTPLLLHLAPIILLLAKGDIISHWIL